MSSKRITRLSFSKYFCDKGIHSSIVVCMRHLFVFLLPLCVAKCPTDTVCDDTFNKCYKYVVQEAPYFAAEENCMAYDGHLTSIQNAFENAIIGETADSMFDGYTDYWIGANYIIDNKWSWTDGTPWHYANWSPSNSGFTDVASVLTKSYLWTSSHNDLAKPYVCELPYKTTGASTSLPVTRPTCPIVTQPTCPACPHIRHCESGWTLYSGTNYCYKNVLWYSFWLAEEICQNIGGHLVSIHSEGENNFISDLTRTGTVEEPDRLITIGFYEMNSEWFWTDGTKVNYTKWASGEPKSGYSGCARLYPEKVIDKSGQRMYRQWFAYPCTDRVRSAVCKKPAL